jgi:hypothetical protein
MNEVERAGDGLERLIDRRVTRRLLLQHGERVARGVQRGRPGFEARGATGRLDAMQSAHGAGDGLGHRHHLRRDIGALQRA